MEPWERWLAMAQDSLQSARDLDLTHPRSAISRYYYAAYQAITAVLLYLEQLPPERREAWSHAETPRIVVNVLARVLRSRKQRHHIQRELGAFYKMRCDADYVSIATVDKGVVKKQENRHVISLLNVKIYFLEGGKMNGQNVVTVEDVSDWLKQEAERRNIIGFAATLAREDNHWLHFAVGLSEKNISRRANILIDLEDAWEKDHPASYKLLLVPSKVT